MATTQAVSQSGSALDQYSITKQQKKSESSTDQFMTLMLAQLKNQDPTNPMDNSQFLTQLAQLNTASGMKELGTKMDSMVNAVQSSQALTASSLVGRNVLVPSDTGYLDDGGSVGGAINLDQSVSALKVQVFDAKGKLVREEALGPQASGQTYFVWDGKDSSGKAMASGTYKFVATATVNGKSQAEEIQVAARVGSVSLGKAGESPTLNLVGVGPYSLDKVQQFM